MIAVCQSHNRPCLYEISPTEPTPVGQDPEKFLCFRKWAVACDEPGCTTKYTLSQSKNTNELTWAKHGTDFMHVPPNCEQIKRGGRLLQFGSQLLELEYNLEGKTPHKTRFEPSNPSSSNTRHFRIAGFKPDKVYNFRCERHGDAYLTIVHDKENNQCVVSGTALEGGTRLDTIDEGGTIYRFHGEELRIDYNDGKTREPTFPHHFMNYPPYYGRGQHPWDRFGDW